MKVILEKAETFEQKYIKVFVHAFKAKIVTQKPYDFTHVKLKVSYFDPSQLNKGRVDQLSVHQPSYKILLGKYKEKFEKRIDGLFKLASYSMGQNRPAIKYIKDILQLWSEKYKSSETDSNKIVLRDKLCQITAGYRKKGGKLEIELECLLILRSTFEDSKLNSFDLSYLISNFLRDKQQKSILDEIATKRFANFFAPSKGNYNLKNEKFVVRSISISMLSEFSEILEKHSNTLSRELF